MNPHTIKRLFPGASASVLAANANDYGEPASASPAPALATLTPKAGKDSAGGLAKPRGRKVMNKTEAAFAKRLEAMQARGEIVSFDREGLTLRWPDGMTYTADFSVVVNMHHAALSDHPYQQIKLVEVKGAWIEDDALVKFRAARHNWPLFRFEMWQLKKGEWTKLL